MITITTTELFFVNLLQVAILKQISTHTRTSLHRGTDEILIQIDIYFDSNPVPPAPSSRLHVVYVLINLNKKRQR